MKILLTLFVLLFSSSVVAEKLTCNVEAHGFENAWKNYPDNVFIIDYDDNNLLKIDTMIDIDWNYTIIRNDDDHVFGIILNERFANFLPYYETVTIYKKNLYIITTYVDDKDVTINRGYCRKN